MRAGLRWIALLGLLGPGLLLGQTPRLTVYYYDRLPYYGNLNQRPGGMLLDIARLVFDEAGVACDFEETPAKRIPENLKARVNACSIGWFMTREREATYTFSAEPIYQDHPFCALFNQASRSRIPANPTVKNLLQGNLQLGMIEGFAYGDWLEANVAKFGPRVEKVSIGENSDNMYRMLLGGRFDYMFIGFEEATYILANNPEFSQRLGLIGVPDAPKGNLRYIMFSRGVDPGILEKVNAAIPRIRQGRRYRQIISMRAVER